MKDRTAWVCGERPGLVYKGAVAAAAVSIQGHKVRVEPLNPTMSRKSRHWYSTVASRRGSRHASVQAQGADQPAAMAKTETRDAEAPRRTLVCYAKELTFYACYIQ